MTASWRDEAVRCLAEPGAPRVFGRQELVDWLVSMDLSPPARTLLRTLPQWESQGLIDRVARGIYLNRRAFPLPLPEEAAQMLRPGAIISLASVLGRSGALNNPSYWVTAVLPNIATSRYQLDVEATDGRLFRFACMQEDLLPSAASSWRQDAMVEHARVPTATPEKALLDWVYLSSVARGTKRWPLPALHDLDLSDMDENRLGRLADRMGLVEPLAQLQDAIEREQPRVKVRRPRALR